MKFVPTLFVLVSTIMNLSCQKQVEPTLKVTDQSLSNTNTSSISLNSDDLTMSVKKGLLAYYPFSGNANDYSGYKNNGTINGAILTTDRFNKKNSAYSFGPTSSISINNASNDLNLTKSFSISSWVNLRVLSNGFNGSAILSKHDGDIGSDGWYFGILNYNNNTYHGLNFWGNNPLNINTDPGASGIINSGVWYNYVTTFDSNSKSLNYYLNGNLVYSININLSIISNSKPITIGFQNSTYGTYSDFFNGRIDDIRIYNRAITAQEVHYLSTH